MQAHTSREKMNCRKLTLFLLLQTIIRGVVSQDFAEKHSVPTFIFNSVPTSMYVVVVKKHSFAIETICFSWEYSTKDTKINYIC